MILTKLQDFLLDYFVTDIYMITFCNRYFGHCSFLNLFDKFHGGFNYLEATNMIENNIMEGDSLYLLCDILNKVFELPRKDPKIAVTPMRTLYYKNIAIDVDDGTGIHFITISSD